VSNEDEVDRFFPEPFIRSLDEAHETRARMSHVAGLLADWGRVRDWLRDEDEDEDEDERETYRGLKAQRATLVDLIVELERARDDRAKDADHEGPAVRVAHRPLVDWGDIGIYPPGCPPSEGSVPVPIFLQGTTEVPGGGATGEIVPHSTTDPWEASEPHYQGGLQNLSDSMSVWLRNWRCVIQFPCALCDSRLMYRVYFEEGGAFAATAGSAGLWNWINVREIPDVSAGIDFGSLPDYEVWPIDRTWPNHPNFMSAEIWNGVTLQGSMAVQKGKAPVLALIVGVIVGVANGVFRIFIGGFHPWEMQLFPPGGFANQSDFQYHARVHYRYDPPGPVFHP
jgi:hypothetical protein